MVPAAPAYAAPVRDQQWYLDRVGVPRAHTAVIGAAIALVAVSAVAVLLLVRRRRRA